MMNEEIKFLISSLKAEYKDENFHHSFKFKYKKIVAILKIQDLKKIQNLKLHIENHNKFKHIKNHHLQPDNSACLFLLREKVITKEYLITSILNWCESLMKRFDGGEHSEGYRHGFAGIVERIFFTKTFTYFKKIY